MLSIKALCCNFVHHPLHAGSPRAVATIFLSEELHLLHASDPGAAKGL
jgi:hypothetical protein